MAYQFQIAISSSCILYLVLHSHNMHFTQVQTHSYWLWSTHAYCVMVLWVVLIEAIHINTSISTKICTNSQGTASFRQPFKYKQGSGHRSNSSYLALPCVQLSIHQYYNCQSWYLTYNYTIYCMNYISISGLLNWK